MRISRASALAARRDASLASAWWTTTTLLNNGDRPQCAIVIFLFAQLSEEMTDNSQCGSESDRLDCLQHYYVLQSLRL